MMSLRDAAIALASLNNQVAAMVGWWQSLVLLDSHWDATFVKFRREQKIRYWKVAYGPVWTSTYTRHLLWDYVAL